ncbi:MAG: hypothetical protein A2218_05015 [Elusimicrobia bacterium RIFOXYA2_FULL_53_38]|nr:MAG: hypothetical protein A2218_05015 [Elusimicrobia bacterium RIFOXYA2_FULL_53_38]
MKKVKTLIIASFGLEPKHITLETLAALKKCDAVFSDCLDGAGGAGEFIRRACVNFEFLRGFPGRGIAARLNEAFIRHDTVGFLTYGNPCFLNPATTLISGIMAAAKVKVSILPAVSSFDSIVNLLDLNKFSLSGLRLVRSVEDMEEMLFVPEMETLLFLPGHLNRKENEKHKKRFLNSLRSAYPGEHAVFLINRPCMDSGGGLIKTTVSGFENIFDKVDKATTVFLPAAAENTKYDRLLPPGADAGSLPDKCLKKEKTLIIASYGLKPKQITLETLSALKKCGMVFSHSLESGCGDFIAQSCAGFESLRLLTGAAIAARLEKAFIDHDVVGFLTCGNPFFLNATTALIKNSMAAAKVQVHVLPAVSSFDSIVNLLDLNKFSLNGLRVVDTAASMEDMRFTPEMDTLFFVAGDLNLKGNNKPRAAFLKGVASVYPGAHPVNIINCPSIDDAPGRLINTTVAEFAGVFSKVNKASTILVPAVTGKQNK